MARRGGTRGDVNLRDVQCKNGFPTGTDRYTCDRYKNKNVTKIDRYKNLTVTKFDRYTFWCRLRNIRPLQTVTPSKVFGSIPKNTLPTPTFVFPKHGGQDYRQPQRSECSSTCTLVGTNPVGKVQERPLLYIGLG